VLAPFSGALRWRPHIWLTGSAGVGKTTVVNDMIKRLVAIAEAAEDPTTEAGLRNELKGAALPVLFDEAERTGGNSASRIEAIIELMMSASSSEGRILKRRAHRGVVGSQICFSFCLASSVTTASLTTYDQHSHLKSARHNGMTAYNTQAHFETSIRALAIRGSVFDGNNGMRRL